MALHASHSAGYTSISKPMLGHKNLAYGAKPQRPDNKYLENLEDLRIDMLFLPH